MTNEEKAKAYDEALTTAKRIISKNCSEVEKLCLECIFPQLKESEDERIRKYIIDFVKLEKGVNLSPDDADRMLAYLERQKEYALTEEDKKIIPEALVMLCDDIINHRVHTPIKTDEEGARKIKAFLKTFNRQPHKTKEEWEKRKEQKPVEWKPQWWSEEDERLINTSISFLKDFADKGYENAVECIDWLKSLRPQPQHRDTYYDIIHDILATLKGIDFMQITPEHRVSLLNDIRVKCKNADECAKILDEPQWKPSEKEITAFENMLKGKFPDGIFPGTTLSELLTKLKKLYYNESISSWKPSKEQMDALERCIDYLDESDNDDFRIMLTLYEQLVSLEASKLEPF